MVETLKNYINGEWIESKGNKTTPVYNPTTREIIAYTPISTKEDVNLAVKKSYQAFNEWKETPIPKRARIMFKYQQLLVDNWDELAEIITIENGKNLKE